MRYEFIYLILFSTGTVKAGRTKRIDSRMKEHAKHARAHGVTVADTWHTPARNAHADEGELLQLARSHGGQPIPGNPEFFEGVNYKALLKSAQFRFGDLGSEWEAAMSFEGDVDPWVRRRGKAA